MKKVKIQILWKDRKRHLGLPLSFTRYSLSDDRLFMSSGVLNIRDEEVLLYRVSDISLNRTIFQRLFGVGTVVVYSSDRSTANLELKNVRDPVTVKELIHKQVEEIKIRRNVRMSEITTSGASDCCHDSPDSQETEDNPDFPD